MGRKHIGQTVMFTVFLASASALAQAPGSSGFRSQAQQRREFIAKLKRDIAKVAHSVEVTQELINRSRGAPFLPDIYLRLAELYVEQARYEFYLVHEQRGEDSKGSAIAPTAKLLKQKAVETYERILSDWPDYKDNDKVFFFLGHELRELGQYEEMIKKYEQLVGKFPKSPLVLDAYLVLGDHRFDRQDLIGAKRYYQKILDAPDSPAHDLAHFKMGWVYLNETDYREALFHFEAASRSNRDPAKADTRRERQRLVNVKREALIDLAYAYTEVKKSKGSLRYFRQLAGSRNQYILALKKLARRYFVKQEFKAASNVYRELARLSFDAEQNLDFATRIHEASKASSNFALVHKDVSAMLRALDAYRYDWRIPEAQRKAAVADFELLSRDMTTRAQKIALKRKTKKLGPRVAAAYARYLQSFPKGPNRRPIVENLADTLFESKLFLRAGDRYEEAAILSKEDEKTKEEALFNACVAFHEALKDASKLPRFERIWAQQGLIRNGSLYVDTFPKSAKVPQIKLNIGKSYHEAGEFEKAIGIFDEFIATYPQHANATQVADLILDAYAQQKDYAGLAKKARALAQVPNLGNAGFRNHLAQVAKAAENREVDEAMLASSAALVEEDDVAKKLLDFWERNKSSNPAGAEKALYRAFVQYKSSGDFDRAFDAGNRFIETYPKSEFLGDVFGTLALITSQTGEYKRAADFLESFYKRFPTDAAAQKMLARAANIRQLVGDHRRAIAAYQELLGTVKDRTLRTEYASKMLDSFEAVGDWDGMQLAADDVVQNQPQSAKGHLMLGLAAYKGGEANSAIKSLQKAIKTAGRSGDDASQSAAARAAFTLGDMLYKRFERTGVDGNVQSAAQAKAQLLGQLEGALVDAVGYNRGEWAVAALHRAASAYQSFAEFLRSAPVPEGLSQAERAQYQQLVGEQAGQIDAKATELFETCVAKARQLSVFTPAVLGCVSKGPEQSPAQVASAAPRPPTQRRDELKRALTKNPKDVNAIANMADYFLAAGQPAMAKLMASQGLEHAETDPRFYNKIGMANLLLGNAQDAFFAFKRALDLKHPYAAANMAALMLSFKDLEGAQKLMKQTDLDDLPAGSADLHPGASGALARLDQ